MKIYYTALTWVVINFFFQLVTSFKARDFNVVSALKPCNKGKNRSLNLIPLESYRVHITPKPGTDGSDYINATFLPVSLIFILKLYFSIPAMKHLKLQLKEIYHGTSINKQLP